MTVAKSATIEVKTSDDVVLARQAVRAWCVEAGFRLVDQTKMVTAASELARNMVDFAGGGEVLLELLKDEHGTGIRVTFEDHGPGIADIEKAMEDGYSTGTGLGLGLSGAKRLVNDFSIESRVGKGTIVTITRWR